MIPLVILAGLITITPKPMVCFDPCSTTVTLRIVPSEQNRMVILELEAPDSDYFRRSEMDLTIKTPRVTEIRYPDVPRGNYQFRAILLIDDNGVWKAETDIKPLKVRGDGDQP